MTNDNRPAESAQSLDGSTVASNPCSRFEVEASEEVRTATRLETLEQSFVSVEINGNLTVTPIPVSDTLDKFLVAVISLEALGLTVDPTTGQLKEAETYLRPRQNNGPPAFAS